MSSSVGFFGAFLAGVISFLSPCVLPLIPGYLSFMTGLTAAELSDDSRPARPDHGNRPALRSRLLGGVRCLGGVCLGAWTVPDPVPRSYREGRRGRGNPVRRVHARHHQDSRAVRRGPHGPRSIPSIRTRRGPGDGDGFRGGLDSVRRPDSRRRSSRWQRRPGASPTARCSCSRTRWASVCRSCSSRCCSAASKPLLSWLNRHSVIINRVAGATSDRHRRAHLHRSTDGHRGVAD